jgi:uncharacterized protein (TIGR02186 family)
MRRAWLLGLAMAALAAGLGPASAEALITSLSNHRVFITSNYTGTSVTVFGAIERDAQTVSRAGGYDVVITVRGPRQAITVREKERTGLIWINREQQKFPFAPAYLAVLTSRPVPQITSEALARRFRIGISAVVGAPEFTLDRGSADDPFRAALVRLKQQDRLYVELDRAVVFLTASLFRAVMPLPATAPPGNYDVEVMLLADSVVLAQTRTSFELVKSGFEQQVADIAHDWSALYGLATGAMALLFGWIASVIFRRD